MTDRSGKFLAQNNKRRAEVAEKALILPRFPPPRRYSWHFHAERTMNADVSAADLESDGTTIRVPCIYAVSDKPKQR
jgi:hypothetical protein